MQSIVDNQKNSFEMCLLKSLALLMMHKSFKLFSLDHKVIEGNFVINNGHEGILWPSIWKIGVIPYYFGWCYYVSNQNYATIFLKSCMIDSCVVTRMCLGTLWMYWKKIQGVFAKDQLIYPFLI
jgi:hypothetical protein